MFIKDVMLVSVIAVIAGFLMFFIGEVTGKSILPGYIEEGIVNKGDYELTKVSVDPDVVNLGDSMNIIVKPGDYGVYKKIYIYKRDLFDQRMDIVTLDCVGFKCTKADGIVKEYYRAENYFGNGDFYVKVKDGSKEWVIADFKIV